MAERAYSRVYWSIKDDEKFDTIRDNDHHLATWLRLLMTADAMWPASPDLPASARATSVRELARVELVDLLPGGRYRIHGMDLERSGRQTRAVMAAAARWNATSNANSNADRTAGAVGPNMPSRAEPSLAEPSRANGRHDEMEKQADLWTLYRALTRTAALGPNVIEWLTKLEDHYGLIPAVKALRAEHEADSSPKTLLSRTEKRLETGARIKERDAERDKRQARIEAGVLKRRLDAYRFTGKWNTEWGPEPKEAS